MAQFIESFVACVEMLSFADMSNPGGGPELNRRDAQMAANLAFLASEVYPDKKILVWGATSHLSRKREGLNVDAARSSNSPGSRRLLASVDPAYLRRD
ncbi:MAG: hypothetical protein ACI9F9_001020 [Candidatus Paceibacteria bacterium]|jgi:hypothetical protein